MWGIRYLLGFLALFASSADARDFACLPSAAAVRHEQPEAWPSWMLRVPGHEGTKCWYASARDTAHVHRNVTIPRGNATATTESVKSPDGTNGFTAQSQSETIRVPLPKPSLLAGETRAADPLATEAASGKNGVEAIVSVRRFDGPQTTGSASDAPLRISAYTDEADTEPRRDTPRPLRPIITEAAPVPNEPLPTRAVLAAFFGALLVSSIITGLIFRSARKVRA
jgi:hypothetical protein